MSMFFILEIVSKACNMSISMFEIKAMHLPSLFVIEAQVAGFVVNNTDLPT